MKINNYVFEPIDCSCGLNFTPDVTDLLKKIDITYKLSWDTMCPDTTKTSYIVLCPICGKEHEFLNEELKDIPNALLAKTKLLIRGNDFH